MHGCMGGWVGEWMNGWLHGWIDAGMELMMLSDTRSLVMNHDVIVRFAAAGHAPCAGASSSPHPPFAAPPAIFRREHCRLTDWGLNEADFILESPGFWPQKGLAAAQHSADVSSSRLRSSFSCSARR